MASLGYFWLEAKDWKTSLGAMLMIVGYSMNESALLIVAPALLYAALKRWRDLTFHLHTLIGIGVGGALHYASHEFYLRNPSYLLHVPWERKFKKDLMKDGLHDAADFFDIVSPGHSYKLLAAALIVLVIVIIAGPASPGFSRP